jgi:hypothetical protein
MFYRKYDSGNMSQHMICCNDPKQGISGEDYDFAKDFDLDEEIDSYLNQLEAIPIELFEESHGDSSDGTKGVQNVVTETAQTAARNTPKYLESPTNSENTESTANISSIIAKTVFSVLEKKRQEEKSKLCVAGVNHRQTEPGSNSEDELSNVICGQLVSKTKEKEARVAKVKHRCHNSKRKNSGEKSLSAFLRPRRSCSQEESPRMTVGTNYEKGDLKSKSYLQRRKKKKKRRRKENVYSKNMSDENINIVNTGEIMQQSRCTTRTLDVIETDTISSIEAASSVPLEKYCDSSNDHDDDQNIVPQDIKTKSKFLKFRRDFTFSPSPSSSSSLSGRETVVLPLRDPRLPHLKQDSQLSSLNKWAASGISHVSSEILFQSTDDFCMVSKREPSPFPISKLISEIPTYDQIASDVVENEDGCSLQKVHSSKIVSDCSEVYAETDVASNESCTLLTLKVNKLKLLKKSESKDKGLSTLCYYARKRPPRSVSPSIRSPCKLSYRKSGSKHLQSKVEVRKRLSDKAPSRSTMRSVIKSESSVHKQKLLTPSPLRYSRSEYHSRSLHKIPSTSVSTGQQTKELETPAGSISDTSEKPEIESSKPRNNIWESDLIHEPKFSASMHYNSISPKRTIVDYKSLSPVSSHNEYSPPRKRPRANRKSKFYKSRSRSPYRLRRRSRSVSPWRRIRKYRRSHSRSLSSRRRRSRSRSPKRRRFRSRSPVGMRYLRSRSRSRKSHSPRRGSKKHRRSSSLSVSPPSPARKRTRLKEQTETAFRSLINALNGTQTNATSMSVIRNCNVPATTTNPSAPPAALPTPQLTQV